MISLFLVGIPMAKKTSSPRATAHVIVSNDTAPTIKLRPGMRFEVHAATVVDPELKPAKAGAARLCGGTDTCLALVEL
jgi:hypothetical protein